MSSTDILLSASLNNKYFIYDMSYIFIACITCYFFHVHTSIQEPYIWCSCSSMHPTGKLLTFSLFRCLLHPDRGSHATMPSPHRGASCSSTATLPRRTRLTMLQRSPLRALISSHSTQRRWETGESRSWCESISLSPSPRAPT